MSNRLARIARTQFLGLMSLCLFAGAAADAATGGNVILGHINAENTPTIIQQTGTGPALTLHVKPGQPPLAVNSTKVVTGLNAQRLGGHVAKDFAPAAGSKNYLGSSGVQVMRVVSGPTPQPATLLNDTVIAPAAGTVTVAISGVCDASSSDRAYVYATAGANTHGIEFGLGLSGFTYVTCISSASSAVAMGQSIAVSASWTHDSTASFEAATVLVLFQPS